MAEAREFIKAWQESSSLAEVAQKVRSKKNACRVRGQRYKKMGVPLKEFPPEEFITCEEWWDDLTQYAASLLPEQDPTAPGDQADGGEALSASGKP
jgi:hypothetical protein